MPKSVKVSVAGLFVEGKPPGHGLDFKWLLIRRQNRPFLLLPAAAKGVHVGLELYSAHRRRAKIWRAVMPLLLRTPAAAIFHRVRFMADENSEIVHFLAEQSGMPAARLPTPAIKFGGLGHEKSRFVLLLCDQSSRPVKVIKVGLDPAGRAATEREADLLEKLPANTLGCIRMAGRLKTSKMSAFATAYFPGDSPEDDAGLETLFHSWINPGPATPIESLDAWRELETQVAGADPAAWQTLRPALAGKNFRSTLHHGDFAPWNIRAVNSQNLQVFDWEGGTLIGVPGWDWFHFIVQTSILARRYSVERVSAEVEELLQSPRFEKYAAATGISSIVKPLMLAYLLRHRWVVKPLDGAKKTAELYGLLAAHWGFTPQPQIIIAGQSDTKAAPVPANTIPAGLWSDASVQLQSAWSQLANVFWEPTLTASTQPSFHACLKTAWPTALLCGAWVAALAYVQCFWTNHLMLLPLYAVPCLLASWNMSRRWGTFFACISGVIGPLIASAKQPGLYHADLICWNSLMRFVTMQICVFLADRVHRQKDFFRSLATPNHRPADFAGNWAVVMASGLWFLLVAVADIYTGPRVIFLPLYLFPAMLVTLFLNLRWGTVMVMMAAVVGSADEYVGKLNPSILEVFGWNFTMRFLILFLVILLLDRLSHGNVLFTSGKQNGGTKPASSC
jgi:hypothetical protein